MRILPWMECQALARLTFLGLTFFFTPSPQVALAEDEPPRLATAIVKAQCTSSQPLYLRVSSTDDDIGAISKLLASAKMRFKDSATGTEPCEQLVSDWMQRNATTETFLQTLPSLLQYLALDPSSEDQTRAKAPPFAAGAAGSTRRALLSGMYNAIVAQGSPTATSALLLFSELDDPDLSSKAKNASYDALRRYPWLIDEQVTLWLVNGMHYHEQDPKKRAHPENARALLREFLFKSPLELPYGFPSLYDLSTLTSKPIAPPPGAAGKKLETVAWDAVYSVTNAVLRTWTDLDRISVLADRRQSIISDSASIFGPALYRFSIGEIAYTAGQLAAGIDDDFDLRQRRQKTGELLAELELERRAVVLYALLSATRLKIQVPSPIDLSNADTILDRVSSSTRSIKVHTRVVENIDRKAYDQKNADFERNAETCKVTITELIERVVSFQLDLFVETFRVTCEDHRRFRFSAAQRIPPGYVATWKRHPRIFDFIGLSLALEIEDAAEWRARPPDLDLVRATTTQSIPALLAALRDRSIPWKFLRDWMLAKYQPTFDWIVQADMPPLLRSSLLRGTNIAATDEQYEQVKNFVVASATAELNYNAKKRVWDGIGPTADGLPSQVHRCERYCDRNGNCGMQCGNRPNELKRALIESLNSLVHELNELADSINARQTFGLKRECQNRAEQDSSRVSILFDPKVTRYLVEYVWTDASARTQCTFGFERPLELPEDMAEILRKALAEDPQVLTRFNLDIAPTSRDKSSRTATAISNAANRSKNYKTATQLLHATALYPLYRNFQRFHVNATGYDYSRGYSQAMAQAVRWPVLRDAFTKSDQGLLYDRHFQVFDYVFGWFQPEALRYNDYDKNSLRVPLDIDPTIIRSIIDTNNQLVSRANGAADEIIRATLAAVQSAQNPGWSIGISIGTTGYSTFGMMNFSINGIGANIGFSLPSIALTNVVLDWRGIKLPVNLGHIGHGYPLRSIPNSLLTANNRSSEVPGTSIAVPWTKVPPVSWAPSELDNQLPANRALFAALLTRALPALTDAEAREVLDALKLPKFPVELANKLFVKSHQGIEMLKIAAGEWYPTSIDLRLVPVKRPGQPCPTNGCVDPANEQQLDKYIRDFNDVERKRLEKEVAELRSNDGRPFRSDVPAVTITYGPDFIVMVTQFAWPTKKGTVITERILQRTPPFIVDRVRANPSGHEFEKWVATLVEGLATPNGVSDTGISEAKGSWIEELGDRIKLAQSLSTDPLFQAFLKQVEQAWSQFWGDFQNHGEKETEGGVKDDFANRFVPPNYGVPMLRFFEPPWQHAWEQGMTMEDWLVYQRTSAFYKRVRDRGGRPPQDR
jgi:hypothetical protein